MELKCALVLLIVGLTTASPYGYGTKGGAAAKADASAVAGAYTSAGEIPLAIPSGAAFSGSFSKSYSSSSASSSASSSSSSFSYGGTGVVGGCGSGNCNGGLALGSQKSATGAQAYSGANAGSLTGGYGGKTHSGSYGHKYNSDKSENNNGQDCGSGSCTGTDNLTSNGNGAKASSQSISDAKASSGAEALDGQGCSGPECNISSGADVKCSTGQCGQNIKCITGNCGTTSQGPDKKVSEGSSSVDYDHNDIHVKKFGSDCSNGNCGSSSAPGSLTPPSYNKPATHLTVPKFDAACSGPNCQNKQSYTPTDENTSSCNGGNCGFSQTKAPYTSSNSQNVNQISQSANGISGASNNGPSYSHGSSLPQNCIPGNPGCVSTTSSNCASGNCGMYPSAPNYDVSSSIKPSYSPSTVSGCASGNCAQYPSSPGFGVSSSVQPGNFPGTPPLYTPEKNDPSCLPGSPGCGIAPPVGPTNCASVKCGTYPASPSYGGYSNIKPSYSHSSLPSYSPGKPSGSPCVPGTLGCGVTPSFSSPSGCTSGNCGTNPSVPSYGLSSNINPSYSHSSLPSYSPGKPLESQCAPGSPGCSAIPLLSVPSSCTSGNCGTYPSVPNSISNNKPSHSDGHSPSYSQGKPLGCAPGTPGCGTTTPMAPGGLADCALGNCGVSAPGYGFSSIKPAYSSSSPVSPSGPACAPGTPGCAAYPLASIPSGCKSGNCAPYPSTPSYGGAVNFKPSYSYNSSPSYSQAKPSGASCVPGSPGCNLSQSGSGPSDCLSGNCGDHQSSLGCSPETPGCSGTAILSGQPGFPSGHPASTSGNGVVSHDITLSPSPSSPSGTPAPSYGASGAGSSYNQANFGSHGSGTYNKPISGFPTGSSGSGSYTPGFTTLPGAVTGIGSPSHTGSVGATAGSNSQQGAKQEISYTGGFGGPGGILKPNEYKAPTSGYGTKPSISTGPTSTKPTCTSGICDQSSLISATQPQSGSVSGAQASAEATANSNAIAYTGGFGGPPGYLKPYDNGKVDLKVPTGNQLPSSLHGGSGIHSAYSNGGSQAGATAVAQANAASISSAGVNSDNHKHGSSNGAYGHDQGGGCGGGCGGSGGSNYGHSGSLGHSKAGVLDNSSNGSATAGAVAQSVANASSGARSYGGSYSSSSASAHATSGASVKGGYGRR